MWAIPRLVLPEDHFLPTWQSRSSDVGDSLFHATLMLFRIRTRYFDFNRFYLSSIRDADPSVARELKWIDRVRNHSSTETEIVLGDRVANTIPRIVERLAEHSGIPDGLLDRVDAEIHGTDLMGQLPGDRRLPSTG